MKKFIYIALALCTIISWTFPMAAERAGSWTFAFFAVMMGVQLVWAIFFMPETKGGTIEDIERRLGITKADATTP